MCIVRNKNKGKIQKQNAKDAGIESDVRKYERIKKDVSRVP